MVKEVDLRGSGYLEQAKNWKEGTRIRAELKSAKGQVTLVFAGKVELLSKE